MTRLALLAACTLAACATAAHAEAKLPPKEACAPSPVFNATTLDHLEGYRFFTGPDGDTVVEPYRIDAKQIPLLKTGKLLGLLNFFPAPKHAVGIVVGPPNVDLPMHAAPYREMFIMLAGSTQVMTRNFKAEVGPGSVLFFEDTDAKTGHGGRTGPCGYTSISVAP